MFKPIWRVRAHPAIAAPVTAAFARTVLCALGALVLGGCVGGMQFGAPYYGAQLESSVEVAVPPPPLPAAYVQPPCPGEGYLWRPGYWAYAGGYYWVAGTWVRPPQVGLLWTPGYWAYVASGGYLWHRGYWGARVGFYGGVHYGHGYDGDGFDGGRWVGRRFIYNRYVTNVDRNFARGDTYERRVHRGDHTDRVSYDGGRGGLVAHPSREDRLARREAQASFGSPSRARFREAGHRRPAFEHANRGYPFTRPVRRPGARRAPAHRRYRGNRPYGRRSFAHRHLAPRVGLDRRRGVRSRRGRHVPGRRGSERGAHGAPHRHRRH